MCRVHTMVTTATPVASSNYNSLKVRRVILENGHKDRMEEISKMPFKAINPTVKHNHKRPYVVIWGNKVYIPKDKVEATVGCGMKVYYE